MPRPVDYPGLLDRQMQGGKLVPVVGTVQVDSGIITLDGGEVILDGGETAVRFIDEDGVEYGIRESENRPLVVNVTHGEVIAEGNLVGHEPVRRFGHNADVAAAWETVYNVSNLRTYLVAGERLQITSSAAADDGAPLGNGARTVRIDGLDNNYVAIDETVVMNGVANVLTDAAFFRISCLTVTTAGVTGYNEGTITASNNADTIVLEQIEIQKNASLCACYTVPAGYILYITQVMATEASNKGSQLGFWARMFGGLWTMKRTVVLLDSGLVLPMTIPMKLPQKTDIEIRAKGVLAGANVTAGFEGWIEVA